MATRRRSSLMPGELPVKEKDDNSKKRTSLNGNELVGDGNGKKRSNVSTNESVGNPETIKVICRFRPGRVNANSPNNSSKGISNGPTNQFDNFHLNEQTGEVKVVSEYSDGRSFNYDKVSFLDILSP
jgi:hypothetical protein